MRNVIRTTKEGRMRQVRRRTAEFAQAEHTMTAGTRRTEPLGTVTAGLLQAQEKECSHVAREIHDDLSQPLSLIGIEVTYLWQHRRRSVKANRALYDNILRRVRELMSSFHALSHQLHPERLGHLGLVEAIRSLCREMSQLHDIAITFSGENVPKSLSRHRTLMLYRITQEALRNIVDHSHAHDAAVKISCHDGTIILTISDSGIGFNPVSRQAKSGLGIISMKERARIIGASFCIRSQLRRGTTLIVKMPLRRHGHHA